MGCFWITRCVSIDEDEVIGNDGGAVVGGRDAANEGDADDSVGIGGVAGGVLPLSNGLTRSNWGKLRFGSYLESASLKTTEEFGYTEDASTAVVEVVLPVYELVVSGASVIVGMAVDDGLIDLWTVAEAPDRKPDDGALDSLAALPRFLFANSYISPNIPAKVFLRFFIVSSASSATEVCDCVARGGCV